MTAAVGIRDHSGWAVLVALSGSPAAPVLVERRRLALCPDDLPRQAFHAAASCASPDEAADVVARVERAVAAACAEALAALPAGATVSVSASPRRVPDDLDEVLAAHPLLHAAEGDLYRRHLVTAAERAGAMVIRYSPKTVLADAAAAAGLQPGALDGRLRELGRAVGPPWQQDHRTAAAAAVLGLVSAGAER